MLSLLFQFLFLMNESNYLGICLLCKRTSEIAAPVISICVAVYLSFRNCKGSNNPESPNEGLEAIIEMTQVAENESTRENHM